MIHLLQFLVLLSEWVQIDGAPDEGSPAPDDNNLDRVDGEEGCRACVALKAVAHSLVHMVTSFPWDFNKKIEAWYTKWKKNETKRVVIAMDVVGCTLHLAKLLIG